MPKTESTGKLIFHNKAGKQFATAAPQILGKPMFDNHTLTISIKDGSGPTVTQKIAPDKTFEYQPKSDKIQWKVESNHKQKGFPSFEQTQHLKVGMPIYIVERNEVLGFAVALEWPPRSISPK
jgi:hypothetical protein